MILYLTSFLSLVLFGYYLWYLTWPKARGVVERVETGVSNVSQIRSPRKYRMVYYRYELVIVVLQILLLLSVGLLSVIW